MNQTDYSDDEAPIIWVKTPKCAGTSVLRAIEQNELPVDVIKWGSVRSYIESTSEALFWRADKFAIVRNPFDRLVSSYHFCVDRGWISKHTTFKSFALMSWDEIRCGDYPMVGPSPSNAVFWHTRPLTDHLSHDLGSLDYLDRVLRFEYVESELNELLRSHGVQPVSLPVLNTSKRRHYGSYYDDETRRIVAEKFCSDFERFDYDPTDL